MSEKVLIISYLFPPIGGGGVIRTLKFTKYLPYFSYKPTILTTKNGFYPIRDETLLAELSFDTKITRVEYLEPLNWLKARFWTSFLQYFLYPFFLLPDRQILWIWPAYKKASELVKKENIKIVYTSSAPASDHLIGYLLKKKFKIQWVADFRDEWANNPFKKYPTQLHRWLNFYLERKVVRNADRVVSVSEPITQYLKSLQPESEKFQTITNGFDAEDFGKRIASKRNKTFTIIFSGTVYNSKIIHPFLEAVKNSGLNVKTEFIGLRERLPHKEAVKKLFEADVLLLILDFIERPGVITGKLFEYLAARKPILAIMPKSSEAAKIIKKEKVGLVCTDKKEIVAALEEFYERWNNHMLYVPKIDLKKYERKNLTEALALIFDGLNSKRKIKLCIIGNENSPQIKSQINFFQKKYEVNVISPKPGGSTFFYFIKSLLRIRGLINEIKPDIVHGQDLVFSGIWAYLSGFHPYVATPWGSDVMNYEKFILPEKIFIKKTLQNADLVTVSSRALQKKSEAIGLAKAKAEVVHFGINLGVFMSKTSIKNQVIFCPRAIAPIYNTDILVLAFAKISQKNPRAILALLDNVADKNYVLGIEKLIIKLDLVDKVQFWPKVENLKMADYYNHAEVIATISSSDGESVSFLEAMACEKKIVATDLPFVEEYYQKNNIWRVPIRNVDFTKKALAAALKFNSRKWQKIGKKNRQLIVEKAEVNSNFEKLDKLYRSCLNN